MVITEGHTEFDDKIGRMRILEKNYKTSTCAKERWVIECELGKVYNWLMYQSDYPDQENILIKSK